MLSVSESWGVFAADALVVAWSCGMLLIDSLQLFGRQNLLKLLVVFFMDVDHLALLCKTLFDAYFYFCVRQGWLFTLGTFCTPLGTTFLHRFSIFFATVVHFLQILLVADMRLACRCILSSSVNRGFSALVSVCFWRGWAERLPTAHNANTRSEVSLVFIRLSFFDGLYNTVFVADLACRESRIRNVGFLSASAFNFVRASKSGKVKSGGPILCFINRVRGFRGVKSRFPHGKCSF